ncbi:hypothetical protein EXIGLDRAFT_781017 [Exidia glandulosa HHB12029]|uniref:Uncharacterized protein n=1 Tax=Exidia glandulosa HHB12029 TaxID=1314781 RepID=A0A165BDQ0_EXIGL|nr:hypothetical protein EXIGLDRAFT_781017 [Exidia glandulosa HHB12029]
MSSQVPIFDLIPFEDGAPLKDLTVSKLHNLRSLLHLPHVANEKKIPLRDRIAQELDAKSSTYSQDARLRHFYALPETQATAPRKTSADKAADDQAAADNAALVLKKDTPALLKLLEAGIPLAPTGILVPQGTIPVESDDDQPRDQVEDQQPSPPPRTDTDDESDGLSDGDDQLVVRSKDSQKPGPRSDSPNPFLDGDKYPGCDLEDKLTLLNVEIHFPDSRVDEITLELSQELEDSPYPDYAFEKTVPLTSIIPKVLQNHTPLKDARGRFKVQGNGDGYKDLGSLDKLRNNDFSKFNKFKISNLQPVREKNGLYTLPLYLEADPQAHQTAAQTGPGPTSSGNAPSAPVAVAAVPPPPPPPPAAAQPAPPAVTTDPQFHIWLRDHLRGMGIAIPDAPSMGDNMGQVMQRIQLWDKMEATLKPYKSKVHGYLLPNDADTFGQYAGTKFTTDALYKVAYLGRTQTLNDLSMLRGLDPDAHASLIAWRKNGDPSNSKFSNYSRGQLRQWIENKLEKTKQSGNKGKKSSKAASSSKASSSSKAASSSSRPERASSSREPAAPARRSRSRQQTDHYSDEEREMQDDPDADDAPRPRKRRKDLEYMEVSDEEDEHTSVKPLKSSKKHKKNSSHKDSSDLDSE